MYIVRRVVHYNQDGSFNRKEENDLTILFSKTASRPRDRLDLGDTVASLSRNKVIDLCTSIPMMATDGLFASSLHLPIIGQGAINCANMKISS